MTAPAFELVRAGEADLPFVMATERLDDYAELVGRWSLERHLVALADGRHAYFVGQPGDGQAEPVGFAIVRDWGSPEQVSTLKRIAVRAPGQGWGRRMLRAVVDAVFSQTPAHRLWLGVYPDNVRARRAYEAVGFVGEGVARGSALFGGVHRDELIMAVLRPDWASRGARGERV